MRFLIDAQLPPSLARWLGERGYSASAARDEGLRDADDGSICNFAMKGMWIIVTKDEDMVNMALWLKKNNFEVDQVQTFYPSPMSLATA